MWKVHILIFSPEMESISSCKEQSSADLFYQMSYVTFYKIVDWQDTVICQHSVHLKTYQLVTCFLKEKIVVAIVWQLWWCFQNGSSSSSISVPGSIGQSGTGSLFTETSPSEPKKKIRKRVSCVSHGEAREKSMLGVTVQESAWINTPDHTEMFLTCFTGIW